MEEVCMLYIRLRESLRFSWGKRSRICLGRGAGRVRSTKGPQKFSVAGVLSIRSEEGEM